MSLVGKELTEFTLMAYQENAFLHIGKADFLGRWSVLFFYPENFSVVCPTELADLHEEFPNFQKISTQIVACSINTSENHKKWLEETPELTDISYALLADEKAALTKWFDVLETDGKPQRATFIIDPNGIIQSVEINAYGIGRKAKNILEKVKAAQYIAQNPGEACPAKWQEGGETVITTLDLDGKI